MKSVLFGLMASTLLALGSMGCSSGGLDIPADGQGGGSGSGTGTGSGSSSTASTPPICTTMGTTYAGFGGSTLGTDRVQAVQGADRGRMKPFSALYTTAPQGQTAGPNEYQRVSSYTPPILANNGATFSDPPANWYLEPEASAIGIYTSYRAAFQSCLQVTATGAQYSAAPTSATATSQCTTWTRAFWSRDASPDELTACENVATNDTATETDVNKRWAYVCASVLNSAGFLSY